MRNEAPVEADEQSLDLPVLRSAGNDFGLRKPAKILIKPAKILIKPAKILPIIQNPLPRGLSRSQTT